MGSGSFKSLSSLWSCLSRFHKLLFIFVCTSSILAAILEALVIFSFIPFITTLTKSKDNTDIPIPNFLDTQSLTSHDSGLYSYLIFISLIFLSSAVRLAYIYLTTRTSASIGSYLSKKVYSVLLHKSYLEHVSQESSYVIQMVSSNITRTVGIISSCSLIISSFLVSCAILYSLLKTEFNITLSIVSILILSYIIIYNNSKGGLYRHGEVVRLNEQKIIRLVKESIDSIREIIINNMYKKYISEYLPIDKQLRRNQAKATFIAQYPRYIIEALMISIITTAAFYLNRENDSSEVLPLLAIFSLGFLRILPSIQQIYLNLANIKSFTPSLLAINSCINNGRSDDPTELKGSKLVNNLDLIGFASAPVIELSNVSFQYPNKNQYVLKNINVTILKGKSYALIGSSGSGKSTLQDLLLGLLPPSEGAAYFKGMELKDINTRILFHSFVAHVPQSPLIINSSIKDNIIFGSNKNIIDEEKIINCLKITCMWDFCENQLLDYKCGENGIKLSGGQKQRLAIARAIYSNREILFLDECTSALDSKTEATILSNIFKNYEDKTIISITHKKDTLKFYDELISLD